MMFREAHSPPISSRTARPYMYIYIYIYIYVYNSNKLIVLIIMMSIIISVHNYDEMTLIIPRSIMIMY